MTLRTLCLGMAGLIGAGLAGTGSADSQTLGKLTPIASNSVFNGCTADAPSSQPGRVYNNSIIEPSLAVDPTNPGRLLTGVQQDRWDNGGARGVRGGISPDGGKSWFVTLPQGTSQCSGGVYPRATDPWVSFGPDGTAYFSTLSFFNDPSDTVNGRSAILASRSIDGGVTWGKPLAVIDDRDGTAFNDKNSVTADPYRPGIAYTVWDRLVGPPGAFKAPGGSDEHGSSDASAAGAETIDARQKVRNHLARLRAAAAGVGPVPAETFGPSFYARTVDGGRTWSRAEPIFDPGPNAQTIGNLIVVGTNGDVYDFYTLIDPAGNGSIGFVRSTDAGQFFGPPHKAADIGGAGIGAVTPDMGLPLRDGSLLFSVAVDPRNDALYLAWEDNAVGHDGLMSVAFSESLDHGATWSRPIRINRTPANTEQPRRRQAFTPTIAAAADGTVVVTYYDFRNDTFAQNSEGTDLFALFCKPGKASRCAASQFWTNEVRLTPSSFNIARAPDAGGLFLGDYMGLVVQGQTAWPAFTTVIGPNRTALWTRPITLPGH